MPVQLTDLKRDKRTLTIKITTGEDELTNPVYEDLIVSYRPSAYTPNAELEFNEKLKGDWKQAMGIAFLHRLVIEWDLTGEDGAPYPTTEEAIAELPSSFISEVIMGVAGDMGKAQPSSADS